MRTRGGGPRSRLGQLEALVAELRSLFETSEEDLLVVANARSDAHEDSVRRARHLTEELATAHARGLASSPCWPVEAHFDDADGAFLRAVGRALLERAESGLALLTSSNVKRVVFVLASHLVLDADSPSGRSGPSGTG